MNLLNYENERPENARRLTKNRQTICSDSLQCGKNYTQMGFLIFSSKCHEEHATKIHTYFIIQFDVNPEKVLLPLREREPEEIII